MNFLLVTSMLDRGNGMLSYYNVYGHINVGDSLVKICQKTWHFRVLKYRTLAQLLEIKTPRAYFPGVNGKEEQRTKIHQGKIFHIIQYHRILPILPFVVTRGSFESFQVLNKRELVLTPPVALSLENYFRCSFPHSSHSTRPLWMAPSPHPPLKLSHCAGPWPQTW